VGTFGILWRPIRMDIKRVPAIMHSIFRLHNARVKFLKDTGERRVKELKDPEALKRYENYITHEIHTNEVDGNETIQRKRLLKKFEDQIQNR